MTNPELNKEITDRSFAIELEIRRRPSQAQYPEMWEPLISATGFCYENSERNTR